MNNSLYNDLRYSYSKMSDYDFYKLIRNEEYINIYYRLKRHSRYENFHDRVYDRNMINGLCYGIFYGIDNIKYKRYDILLKDKIGIYKKIYFNRYRRK